MPSARQARSFHGNAAHDAAAAAAATAAGQGSSKPASAPQVQASAKPCGSSSKAGTKPQLWTEEEQLRLEELVEQLGCRNWSAIAADMPGRTGKQCRDRYLNTKPQLKKVSLAYCMFQSPDWIFELRAVLCVCEYYAQRRNNGALKFNG
jgi:hypothetical protein